MPRTKKAARRGGNSHPGSSRSGRGVSSFEENFVPFSGTSSLRGHNGFTLADEARDAERHESHSGSDKKLRYSKVNFVSAGSLSKDDSEENDDRNTESALADMTLNSPPREEFRIEVEVEEDQQGRRKYVTRSAQIPLPTRQSVPLNPGPRVTASGWSGLSKRIQGEDREFTKQQDAEVARRRDPQEAGVSPEVAQPVYKDTWRQVTLNESGTRNMEHTNWTTINDSQGYSRARGFEDAKTETIILQDHPESSTTVPADFVIDTRGEAFSTGLPPPRIRSPSPSPSNSSEEVILFPGRNNISNHGSRHTKSVQPVSDPLDTKIKIVEEKIYEQEEMLEEALHQRPLSPPSCQEILANYYRSTGSQKFETVKPPKHRKRGPGRCKTHKEEEEALIADYLANIDFEDRDTILQPSSMNNRELGGTDDSAWQDETEISSGEPHASREYLKDGWDASMIEDLDDLSTSDGVMGEVQAVYSKRERKSGLQYLIVWEDQTMDEARWVPVTTLTSVTAQVRIKEFEAEEKLFTQFAAVSDDDDDNDDESMDSDAMDHDDTADEERLLQRKIERIDDEQIARLLAKQEELGMGSHELLLFDEAADADEEDGFAAPKGNLNFIFPSTKKTRSKRPRGDFPAATALADAYDGFDVMDFERPSLKKKPKGRKGKLILDDVSDSELEESMQAAWDNDRIKKKERKEEREALRAQGFLGSRNGKPDLKQKYKEGMGFNDVKEEIKQFLICSNSTLALPPMDKADRKIVHEIANSFNLKSKSVGTGKNRSPILYRTLRTISYVERTWDQVESRLTRRFLPRMDVGRSGAGYKKPTRTTGGGGFNRAAVSYQDGDIVGGSAPELGSENRGRAMLEKMGWSRGTALGALNNKGILQPVSHIVKTTKAGLG